MGTKRKSGLVTLVTVVGLLFALFWFVKGTMELVAYTLLPIDRSVAVASAGPEESLVAIRTLRDGTGILRRNIFSSTQGPLDGVAVTDVTDPGAGPDEVVIDDGTSWAAVPTCEGSLRLMAAVMHPTVPDLSLAAIVGTDGKTMLYRKGQPLNGGEVVHVSTHRVYLLQGGRRCHLAMFSAGEAPAPRAVAAATLTDSPPDSPAVPAGSIPPADLEAGITRNSDTNFTIQRSLVDRLLSNQAELMRMARVIPHEENGRTVGVKLYGIRRNSLLGHLGVQNGDMLRTINGYDMSSPNSALEAYSRLSSADHLTLSVVRRGQNTTLDYSITQ